VSFGALTYSIFDDIIMATLREVKKRIRTVVSATCSIFLIATTILVLPESFVAAQEAVKAEKGIVGGISVTNLSGNDADSIGTDSRTSAIAGGFYRYNINPKVAIEPQLLISMKGAKASALGFDVDLKLTYLELPVLFRFTIPTQGNVSPSIFAGPSVGIKLSSKGSATSPGFSIETDLENTKGVEFGLVFGGGITIGRNDTKIFLDGRYNLGLTNVFDDVINPGPNDLVKDVAGTAPDFKNSGFTFSLGIML